MRAEIFYLGHDNKPAYILKAKGAALTADEMAAITRMTLTLGTKLLDSDNEATDPILWAKAGYEDGEFRLILGDQPITPGNYQGVLIVYDATNPNGIVWGRLPLVGYADPEAAPEA